MDPITVFTIWRTIRPFHLLKMRREAKRAAAAGAPIIATPEPITEHEPEHVEKVINAAAFLVGGAKSKLIWLAVAQLLYSAIQLYINNGALTADSMEPLVTGLFTAVFRIYTGGTLAEKGAA